MCAHFGFCGKFVQNRRHTIVFFNAAHTIFRVHKIWNFHCENFHVKNKNESCLPFWMFVVLFAYYIFTYLIFVFWSVLKTLTCKLKERNEDLGSAGTNHVIPQRESAKADPRGHFDVSIFYYCGLVAGVWHFQFLKW